MTNDNENLFDGAWTLYVDPRAVYFNGANSRTYYGWVDTDGTVKVTHYAHAAGLQPAPTALVDFGPDDHSNPSILIRDWDDNRVLVFVTDHNDTIIRLFVSTNAEDATLFGAQQNLQTQIQGAAWQVGGPSFSYPNPIYLADEDKIYLFFRNFPITGYSTSDDGGTTWTEETVLFQDGTQRPYFKCIRYGTGRILFAVTAGHPNETAANNTLHFCYYENGNWYNARGGNLGALPFAPRTDLEAVSTAATWVWDIAVEADGTPRIFYTEYPEGNGDNLPIQLYRHARWNGRKWDISTIVAPGPGPLPFGASPSYSGCGTFDKSNPNHIYLSRRPDGDTANLEIYRYESSDNGLTWQEAKQYTFNSANHCQRPYVVVDGLDDFKFMYFTGPYPTYLTNDTIVIRAAK